MSIKFMLTQEHACLNHVYSFAEEFFILQHSLLPCILHDQEEWSFIFLDYIEHKRESAIQEMQFFINRNDESHTQGLRKNIDWSFDAQLNKNEMHNIWLIAESKNMKMISIKHLLLIWLVYFHENMKVIK